MCRPIEKLWEIHRKILFENINDSPQYIPIYKSIRAGLVIILINLKLTEFEVIFFAQTLHSMLIGTPSMYEKMK